LDKLAELSFDPEYGARPVRRKVQELVEDQLTEGLLNETFNEGDTILLEKDGNELILKKKVVRKVAKAKKSSAVA
jgi:ATP-dependent Clp protease ATP-binding subunit ClpC